MHLNIAVCDDDEKDADVIVKILEESDIADISVSLYTTPSKLLSDYTKAGAFDVLFLDVEMRGFTGLELASQIRNIPDYSVKIIYVSSYPDYMKDSFNVHAYHYLTKPVSAEMLHEVLSNVVQEKNNSTERRILIHCKEGEHLYNPDDIFYVNVDKTTRRNVCFHLADDQILSHTSIKEYEETLLDNNFIYVYRSTLVNLRHLRTIMKKSVILDNKVTLPLSRRYEQNIRQEYVRYNVNSLNFEEY